MGQPEAPATDPGAFRTLLAFLIVSACWGLTSPLLRMSAITHVPTPRPHLAALPRVKRFIYTTIYSILDFLSRPSYAIPLLINLTGSVWFFILLGGAELSLTVPVVNSLALVWTAVGEWAVGKWTGVKGEGLGKGWKAWVGGGLVMGGVWTCWAAKMA